MRSLRSFKSSRVLHAALSLLLAFVTLPLTATSASAAVPGAPSGVAVVDRGVGSITVSWSAPTVNAVDVFDYLIEYSADNGDTWTRVDDGVSATPASVTVTGLDAATAYNIRVGATNNLSETSWALAASDLPFSPRSVANGPFHSCAVTTDGQVFCWGANGSGQLGDGTTVAKSSPNLVPGISGAVSVTVGFAHTCVLLESTQVYCWGSNNTGQIGDGTTATRIVPTRVSTLTSVVSVNAGDTHTCAVIADGSVKCWGAGASGQLGNGSTAQSTTPVSVTGIDNAVSVSVGVSHTCAVTTTNTVKCWGSNSFGQLGDGTRVAKNVATLVPNLIANTVVTGDTHTCAIDSTLQAVCWGSNDFGQLGDGNLSVSVIPVVVSGLANVIAVSAGQDQSCAVTDIGDVWCWGDAILGDGTTAPASLPVFVANVVVAVQLPTDGARCAIADNGSLWCWGFNGNGQVGNGTVIDQELPVTIQTPQIPTLDTVDALPVSDGRCVVLASGLVKCWGLNNVGQLGDGTLFNSTRPVTVSGISTATQVAVGEGHACALLADSTIKCWGLNNFGQLGNNSQVNSSLPVTVSGITTATHIAAGGNTSCAILADTTVKCWGSNSSGQLGDNTTATRLTPVSVGALTGVSAIAVGAEHACAVESAGTVKCWGQGLSGRLGNGSFVSQSNPVAVTGISNAISIAAGAAHTCALLSNTGVQCWGLNSNGQLGTGTTTNSPTPALDPASFGAVAITAGTSHACAVISDGSVQCWGLNSGGQLGDGTNTNQLFAVTAAFITDAVDVAAGATTTCAVTSTGALSCWGNMANGPDFSFTGATTSNVPVRVLASGTSIVYPAQVPGFFTVTSITQAASQLTIRWSRPTSNFSPITGYTVTAQPGGATCTTTAQSCAITGLTNGTSYTISVVASNGVGDTLAVGGPHTAVPAGPPSAPTGVTATVANQSSTVSWTASVSNGALVSAYVVTATPGGATCTATGTTSCTVTGLTNGTAYTFRVVAQSSLGNSAASLASNSVTPAGAPGTPTGVTAVRGDQRATVSWTAPANNGATITGYTVTSSPGSLTCTTATTSCAVTGLTNGTSYTFTVTATNAAGNSLTSLSSAAVIPAGLPTSPSAVSGTAGDRSVAVSWTASNGNGETITGYTVTASPGGATCTTTGATSCSVTGLTNGTSYTFTVVGRNAVGASTASTASSAVTPVAAPAAPSSVTATRGDQKVTVSWTAPFNNGSAITGYTVTSTPGSFTCTTEGLTTCDVTGLTNGTSYTFTVTATNAIGTSTASTASAAAVPAGLPTAPSSPTATFGDGQASVSWTASSANGASITGYTVTSTPGSFVCTTTGATSCTVTGLTNGTSYTFTVVGTNAVGDSEASSATTAVIPAGLPTAPTAASAVRGDQEATVSWTASSGNGRTITGYTVTSNPGGLTCTTTGATTCTVTGLTNGTSYSFSVVGTSAIGDSVASTASSGVIPAGLPTAPTDVVAERGDSSAIITWTAADGNGAAITGYTVTSTPGSFTCTSVAETSCEVVGLTNGTSYTFKVVATNAVGDSPASAVSNTIVPAQIPSAPLSVTATRGDGKVTISWLPPVVNAGAVTTYVVSSTTGSFTCTTAGLSCEISGLTNGTAYSFKVVANSAAGLGQYSAASAAVTPAGLPTSPGSVTATRGNAKVTVSWSASSGNGSAVTGYTVTSTPGSFVCTTTSATTCDVTGLSNGTSYTFAVVATNGVGNSTATTSSAVTPASVPSAPSNVSATRGNTQSTVSWTASNANGDPITSYTVTSTPGGLTCSSSGTSCLVTGLTNGTSYTFSVVATNGLGDSTAGTSAAVTPATNPSAPTNVSATRGNQSATVSWTASANNGSAVTLYTVTSTPSGLVCTTATTSCTVTGLTNGTSYTFSVYATNAVGDSSAQTTTAVVPAAVPTTPGSVTATRGDTKATVSWTASTGNGEAVTGYTVTSTPGSLTCTTTSALTCDVTGLTNGTSYTFSVVATNAVGNSVAGVSSAVTPAGLPLAPTNVVATRGDGQVTISWTAANNNGSAITLYTVASTVGLFGCTTADTSCTITGLTNGTSYTFTVLATNVLGNSPVGTSNAVIPANVPTTPGSVTATRGDTKATVSWTASTGNGQAVTGYTVTSTPGSLTCTTTTATTCDVLGLTNGTSYTFSVVATNAVGNSTAGTSTAVIPAGLPTAPTAVVATRGDGQVTVSWTASNANGSALTTYTVASTVGSFGCTTLTTSCIVTGLTNGSSYTFTVTATNAIGTSSAGTSNAVIPANVPTTPTNVTATRGDGQVTIAWTGSSSNGQPVTGYTVTAAPGGLTCTTTAATTCDITGLTNGTLYTFSVVATNAVGNSTAATTTATPAGLPTAPSAVVATRGDGQVTVSWTASNANGSALTTYTVASTVGSFGCTTLTTSCVVTGLTNGTSYTFTVTATNAVGTSTAGTSNAVVPSNVPSTPANVTAVRGDGRATISWTASTANGQPISGYTVTTNPGGFTCSTTTATTCDITGLTNGTLYTFSVVATNATGSSAAGTATATPAGLPTAPTAVTAVRGDGQVTVSWTASNANGSSITSYVVSSATTSEICTTLTTSCIVTGLTNGTAYSFRVTATNAVGEAVSAATTAVTPAGAPIPPTTVTATRGDAQVTVQWSGAVANGSAITGYRVTSAPGGFTCTTTGATACTVLGLTNRTAYTFTVQAINLIGTSSASTASGSATPLAVPSAPRNVTALVGDKSATVSWTSPIINPGGVTQYIVTSSPEAKTCTTVTTSCAVSGLTNGVTYTFTVVAVGEGENSEVSNTSNEVTPAATPSVPANVVAVRGSTQATVTWDASQGNGSSITGYTVYSSVGSKSCSTVTTSCVVTGLTNGTEYTFTVVARNAVGTSARSVASNAITPASAPARVAVVTVARGNGSVAVSWSPANGNGLPVTGYRVTASDGITYCESITTSCNVTGLTNGVTYTFVVTAFNSAGSSDSLPSVGIAPAGKPSAPTRITVSKSGKKTKISWSADTNGWPVLSYNVSVKPLLVGTWSPKKNTGTATSASLSGLVKGKKYQIRITVATTAGTVVSRAMTFTAR